MRYISVGRRFIAVFIDSLIGAIWWWPLTDRISYPGHYEIHIGGGHFLLGFSILVAYYTAMEAALGASVGKLVVGIRVVMEDGSKITWSAALVRNLLRIVDGLFIYLVAAIVVWSGGPTRQRLGDRVAHTVVIGAGTNVGPTFTMPPSMPGSTTAPPPPIPPPPPPPQ